jgi:AraC-like DNA-binding protein
MLCGASERNGLSAAPAAFVGGAVDSPTDLYRSFAQAQYIHDVEIEGSAGVIYFDDSVEHLASAAVYPYERMSRFRHALYMLDVKAIREASGELIDSVLRAELPRLAARCFCFDALGAVLGRLEGVDQALYRTVANRLPADGMSGRLDVSSGTRLIAFAVDKLCGKIESEDEETSEARRIDVVLRYIHERYLDPNFSIKTVAAAFEMEISNFSHFFKRQVGTGFGRYISLLKVNLAKELLTNTALTVTEIASRLGYSNNSSFIRMFHKTTGLTATAYRDKHSTESSDTGALHLSAPHVSS